MKEGKNDHQNLKMLPIFDIDLIKMKNRESRQNDGVMNTPIQSNNNVQNYRRASRPGNSIENL